MKLSDLREALGRFGYDIETYGHRLNVTKDGDVIETILKKGTQGFEDYDPPYIAGLRKRLGLTPDEGVDSARFYGQRGIVEELTMFMQLRIEVMKKLAKI